MMAPLEGWRQWLCWIAIVWLLALCGLALVAYGSPQSHPTLEGRVRSVGLQLRCPACQGESVADADTDVARDIRTVIRRRLAAGESEDQVQQYLLSRYPNIRLAPSTSGIGSIAWLAPPLLILGGIGLLIILVTDWRTKGRRVAEPGPGYGATRREYLERVRAELAASGEGE